MPNLSILYVILETRYLFYRTGYWDAPVLLEALGYGGLLEALGFRNSKIRPHYNRRNIFSKFYPNFGVNLITRIKKRKKQTDKQTHRQIFFLYILESTV